MSKEKSAAWRSMREVSDKDVRTMQEMHASQFLLRNEVAPRVTDAPEDAMHTLWNSERRINLNGKWYIPISEVADILTAPTETPDPLSEEWQAKCFPNLNIGEPTPKEDSKRWFSVMDRKQRGR